MKKSALIIWGFCVFMILSCVIISSKKPMWLDELYSYYSTQDNSLEHSIQGIANGVNAAPPFYFMITWTFYKLGIHEVLFYRMLSSLCFIAAFVILWKLLKKYFDERIVIACLVLSFGASNLIFSQNSEFRNYAFFFLLESLALVQAVRLIENPNSIRSMVLLASFVGLACLTHIFGVFYGIAYLVSFMIWDWLNGKWHWKRWIACIAGIGFIAVWINQILLQAQVGKPHSWIPVPNFASAVEVFSSLFPFGDHIDYEDHSYYIILAIAIGLVTILYVAIRKSPTLIYSFRNAVRIPRENQYLFILSISLILVPIFLSYVVSRTFTSIFLLRYLIPSILGVILLVMSMVAAIAIQKPRLVVYACWILIFLGFARLGIATMRYRDKNLSSLAQVEAKARAENVSVIFQSPQCFMPFQFYFNSVQAYYPLDWKIASAPANALCSTSDYKSMVQIRSYYNIPGVRNGQEIMSPGKMYFVVDEPGKIWLQYYVGMKKISVLESYLLPNGLRLKKILFN